MLLTIASYGQKNIGYLRQLIQSYRRMDFELTVVVVSEAPKDLGEDVEVVVGLPSRNTWSLPFAHKKVLAQNLDSFDLFIYSEDDVEVTEENIRAFLRVTPKLRDSEIAGFIRHETDDSGAAILTDVHGPFRWKPESVERRGDCIIAEFTNDHAGFYVLTQDQLRRAVATGRFLKGPYDGRYGLPETAATDIYTICSFRKVICISEFDNFLIRHMSNLYVHRHGVPLPLFKKQIETLIQISNHGHPATTLCEMESKMSHLWWSKSLYEKPTAELLDSVPQPARRILSVGCGWGLTEAELKNRGAEVTGLALDSVIGTLAASSGIEMIYGALTEGLSRLTGRRFDCLLISDLLHLLPEPWDILQRCVQLLESRGHIVIAEVNFQALPIVVKRRLGVSDYAKLGSFNESGIHPIGVRTVKKRLRRLGLCTDKIHWLHRTQSGTIPRLLRRLGPLGAERWILRAQKQN